MAFNENSRVKIPALLHLMRLGYTYIPLREHIRREDTNIFESIFLESLQKINPSRSLSPALVSDYQTQLPDRKLLQQKLHEIFENSNAENI